MATEMADGVADPERQAERVEGRVEIIRSDLGDLIDELERRRHRSRKPQLMAAVATVVAGLALGGGLLWWRRRSRGDEPGQFMAALKRVIAHPERVAPKGPEPRVTKRIAAAAAASVASVLARRAAEKLLAP
jgi:hypothetical protein